LLLKSESIAHEANLKDDYSKIKAAAAQQKDEREFTRWLSEKAKDTYVYVHQSYHHCNLMNKWIKTEHVVEKKYD
ncbi:MAG TPA: hypothetical protein VNJ07_13720, partial [Chitinophagales bacterium]|nr:hypothetical protein [Chitinophagales bacterium]